MRNTGNEIRLPIGKRIPVINLLAATDKVIVSVAVLLYIGYLVFYTLKGDYIHVWHSVEVPAVGFGAVGILRKIFKVERPKSELSDKKNSYSFPSRHAYSVFAVSMVYLQTSLAMAVVIGVLGIVLCIVRVEMKVHYPKDVIFGGLMGIFCGFLGFLVLL